MSGHHTNASLEESQRIADEVSELHPCQVDDDRDTLALSGLEHLRMKRESKPNPPAKAELALYLFVFTYTSRP